MTTLAVLRAQIADDIASSDLTTQIATAIKAAVRSYETDRFWFNEVRNSSVTLSTSVASIPIASLGSTFLRIDRIRRLLSSNNYIDLIPRDYSYIMASQDTALLAPPSDYCIYANALQFDCRAASNETLVLDGIVRLSTASAASDTALWFSDGSDLIRACAKRDLYTHVLFDAPKAGVMAGAMAHAYSYLKGRTTHLQSSGTIRSTGF